MRKIGFVGIGVMGKSMARNLMKAGYEVSVYTRTKSKALEVIEEGAMWCESIKELAVHKDVIITMVGYPKDVEQVYFGEEGIIANASEGTYLIDMTTTSPKLSVKIFSEGEKRGLKVLDAPVSGGDVGAKNATLSIMVGGNKEDYESCLPIFNALGKTIIYEGAAGSGQHTKMANQIAIAGAMAGVCEALTYAKEAGLDLNKMLDSIATGAAGSWQLSNLAPRMLKGDFAPGFFVKHYIKDMSIAKEQCGDMDIDLGVLDQVYKMYCELEQKGMEDLGTQALIKYYTNL